MSDLCAHFLTDLITGPSGVWFLHVDVSTVEVQWNKKLNGLRTAEFVDF